MMLPKKYVLLELGNGWSVEYTQVCFKLIATFGTNLVFSHCILIFHIGANEI